MATVTWTGVLDKVVVGDDDDEVNDDSHFLASFNGTFSYSDAVFSGFKLPNSWVQGGGNAYVRSFGMTGSINYVDPEDRERFANACHIGLHATDTGLGNTAGPDLKPALLGKLGIKVTCGENSVSFVLTAADTSEPYNFNTTNRTGVINFVNALEVGHVIPDVPIGFYNTTIELSYTTSTLYAGDDAVKKAYVGSTQVEKVYLGETLLYE